MAPGATEPSPRFPQEKSVASIGQPGLETGNMGVSVRMCQPRNKQPQVTSFSIVSARAAAQGLAPCGHLETLAPFLP